MDNGNHMENIWKTSGIPLKMSLISILVFSLGVISVFIFNYNQIQEHFNSRLNEQNQVITEVLTPLLKEAIKTRKKDILQQVLSTFISSGNNSLIKISVINTANRKYFASTTENDLNQLASPELMKVLQNAVPEKINSELFQVQYEGELKSVLQFVHFFENVQNSDESARLFLQVFYDSVSLNTQINHIRNTMFFIGLLIVFILFLLIFISASRISVAIRQINTALEGVQIEGFFLNLPKRSDELSITSEKIKNIQELIGEERGKSKKSGDFQEALNTPSFQGKQIDIEGVFVQCRIAHYQRILAQNYSKRSKINDEMANALKRVALNHKGEVINFNGEVSHLVFRGKKAVVSAVEFLQVFQKKIEFFCENHSFATDVSLEAGGAIYKGKGNLKLMNVGKYASVVFTGPASYILNEMAKGLKRKEIFSFHIDTNELEEKYSIYPSEFTITSHNSFISEKVFCIDSLNRKGATPEEGDTDTDQSNSSRSQEGLGNAGISSAMEDVFSDL